MDDTIDSLVLDDMNTNQKLKLPRMKVKRFQYKLYNNKLRKFERRELTYVEDKNKVQESIC